MGLGNLPGMQNRMGNMTGNMQGNLAPAGNMPAGGGMHMQNFNDMSAIIGAGNLGGSIGGSNMQANLMGNMPANLPSNLNINMGAMNMVSVKMWQNDFQFSSLGYKSSEIFPILIIL